MSRRRFLLGAAGGLGLLGLGGVAGYEWPRAHPPSVRSAGAAESLDEPVGVLDFVSRPDLRPPLVRVAHHHPLGTAAAEEADSRYIFVSPRHDERLASQQGLMVLDRHGHLVWFHPIPDENPFDLDVQTYEGRPVLTWWQGRTVDGYGIGNGEMADASYRHMMTIRAGDGLRADLHELNLTPRGTALVTAYESTTADLSSAGGSRHGRVLVGHAQEVDLKSGRVLFDWNSLDHVGLAESYETVPSQASIPYDYFHINSISETPDGNLLISAKNTWALYKVDRSSGAVIWRINGKRSDFALGPGARFYWQHDSRMVDAATLTVFDDGSFPPEERQSRALILSLDEAARQVGLVRAYLHPAGFLAANQGSVQLLPDGRVFVGWGNQPYFSEFDADGTLILDGQFPIDVRSYRAFELAWEGMPADAPALAARSNPAGGTIVYASWNGATSVDRWMVLAGEDAHSLEVVGSQAWSRFETVIAVNSSAPSFVAVAVDATGKELGRSPVARRDGPPV